MDMITPMDTGTPDGDGMLGGQSGGGGGGRGSGRRDLSEDQFVFRSDGAFHDGGFTITPQGLTSAPDMLSRRDSDGSSVEGVPKSRHNVIHVASLNEFRKGHVLGSGANGTVYLTVHQTTRRHMAVKTVNVYDEEKRKQLLQELGALTRHVSRFLVRFYGAFYDGSGAVHIALEYMDCGALSDAIAVAGRVPEAVLNQVAVHCLRGLRFLHRNHVLHRDLKTANILLSRRLGRAKLSDFGLARDLHPGVSKADTFVGTMAYMSPERLQGERYTYASDVWGLGVSLAECALGRYPFPKPQNFFDYIAAAQEDVLGGVSDFGPHSTSSGGADDVVLSDDARDFLARCTAVDPADRPTACALLEHPWIRRRQREPTVFADWLRGVSGKIEAARSRAKGEPSPTVAAAAAASAEAEAAAAAMTAASAAGAGGGGNGGGGRGGGGGERRGRGGRKAGGGGGGAAAGGSNRGGGGAAGGGGGRRDGGKGVPRGVSTTALAL